ncbi:unnamed protein product [Adineta steineri]|uniref:ubiquitinyl hydrolase 1 n=1 Tax=Adineta steineri TaxID=433720 RepID=A0A818U3X7_9BILA|nr:unnamed protein product [Adineta steineri]CAF3693007.1 unnamed protein product [Adineta steineri]
MNDSIINHLFLPHYLPSSADDDFLIERDHQNEHNILECMNQYFHSNTWTDIPIFRIPMDCIERWCRLQGFQNFIMSNIQSAIQQLPLGHFLPIYFHGQNAAILIEIGENNSNQPIISAWEVLLSTESITSSLMPHFSHFPVTTYRLCDRSELTSTVHCELLMDFMYNTIEYSKSYKASQQVDEIRDVPQSHYVCQWWIQQFNEIQIEKHSDATISFKKKHRDQIRWNKTKIPFRRSGLWMTIKVVLHTILVKRLKDIGTVVYKLLITHFLTYIIYTTKISTDLLIHCIKKIVRRLNKIERLLLSINSKHLNTWIISTKQEIERKINQIIPRSNLQNTIKTNEQWNEVVKRNNLLLRNNETYQHSLVKLKAYLSNNYTNEISGLFTIIKNYDDSTDVNQDDYIPSYDVLTTEMNCTIGVALTFIEIWIELCLEQWINRPALFINGKGRFETLFNLFEKYQNAAINYYYSEKGSTDPLGYSRFILTSLAIIYSMHKNLCLDERFEQLKQHSINIPNLMALFEFLVLPNREDMIRASYLHHYFNNFRQKPCPDLLNEIESGNSFGVKFATRSPAMNDSISRIRNQAAQDKENKIKEVNNAKQKYTELMVKVYSSSCEFRNNRHWKKCPRCKILKQANAIQVKIFECPMPLECESALAVIFELQMPIEIRCYREILWQFTNRAQTKPGRSMYEWLNISPHNNKLEWFNIAPKNCQVQLVSPTKSITQTHYSSPPSIQSTPVGDFLFENSLTVEISPVNPIEFEDECCILTPQLDHPDYEQLKFTLNTTEFIQNHVIAQLSDCSARLKPSQFVEFGSFRSGHRLQWWNLLTILEMDSLSIAEESVAILIIHSILQHGPLTADNSTSSTAWCPESHEQLLEDHFIDELIARLNRRLEDCESNWQNELVLMVITVITMRILTICNSTKENQVARLAKKCRKIGEKWIDLIIESIQTISPLAFDEVENLRLKLINVGVCSILTFSAAGGRIRYLLSSNEHIVSLLKAATTVHDNIILSKQQSNMSTFMVNMMRYSERVLVRIQPIVAKFLQKTSYQGLNEFVVTYWAILKREGIMNAKWKKRTKYSFDGWYDCQYKSKYISIDCIKGTLLIDGMTIGFLPEKIIFNELFIRVFGQHIFEVQAAESPNTYITKHSYHGDERVLYEFCFNDQTKYLIIKERHMQTKNIFQLISQKYFEPELPDMFVSNYSHWLNTEDQIIEFRPVCFKDMNFLKDKPYILTMNAGYITTEQTGNMQRLINQSSSFFQDLFLRYFSRLDDKPYVYMMRVLGSQANGVISIYLSRLMIAFQYNTETNIITSREYPDMCINDDQWFGTLNGLTFGLLLSPLPVNNHKFNHYPSRKLIVPFGKIHSEETQYNRHQTVTIQRTTSSKEFLHHYFVFILNDRLCILQSNDSPTGWLYLALLHAITSHPLPDQYTGMTGMERAFQLLNSPGCSSDQPFDTLSLHILGQIASISPKVDYYPEHLTCMQKIDWNYNGLPYSMQHFDYYLIAKHLIEATQQLDFMYSSSISNEIPKIFEGKLYNEMLLKKLYWHYRDSYNPMARLSTEMENEILRTISSKPHHSTLEHYSHKANYPVAYLVKDLYSKGNIILKDYSNQHWLPLSQWLTDENQLKNIWVGLLKLADYCKDQVIEGNTDKAERFVKLLNFLRYISRNSKTQPFYLQMLKTVLKVPSISFRTLMFPPFGEYQNIEEISVVKNRIIFTKAHTKIVKNQILTEIEGCYRTNCFYQDTNNLFTSTEINRINSLLRSWQSNKNLRSFLNSVQNCICAVSIQPFHAKISFNSQQFTHELSKDHHQIQFNIISSSMDEELLSKAEQKFHKPYSGHFNKQNISLKTTDRQKEFPNQIFPFIDSQDNPLSKIDNYFKNQLAKSWDKFLLDEQMQKEDPSIEEINKFLNSVREESTQFWNELVKSIVVSNELLFTTGVASRIIPTILISSLQQKNSYSVNSLAFDLSKEQCTLLGGTLVNWILEQQMEKALYFVINNKNDDFEKELSNIPHSNWTPSEHVHWLILELEMNIIIRDIQIKVAHHMMQLNETTNGSAVKNIVMQMNMGEGKTSVILPMLAVSLSSTNTSLVRIVVLKSLFPTNHQSLRCKLGGLLNRRIFPFACRRDMNFNNKQINQISDRLKQGLRNCDVILTSPEDILSFDLLTIDKCRRNEFDISRSMLIVQRWLRTFVRDVLDESDEILHVKYQLIYTVGDQQQVDGGAERWKTIQSILELVKKHAATISDHFGKEICYKPSPRKSAFPEFRLRSHPPFSLLCETIANDWIQNRNYRHTERQIILSFILKSNSSIDDLIDKFPHYDVQLFLIIRGLLLSEVLLVALKKRYRVNYGITPDPSFNRLMAVPFRAKDVAADRTEFGHPDIALVLTQLSYYYSGLTDSQLIQCFNRLNEKESDPATIYEQWIQYEGQDEVHTSIKQWKGVNLQDYQQKTHHLFPILRYNMLVVNYFLNHFVFLREAKQFPNKIVSSAWDLSSSLRSKIITGFSGTNDTRLLLPIDIRQHDLPELQKTDAIVVNNLVQTENESYQSLQINATSDNILKRIVGYKENINVILDVGSLFVDGSNRDIAVKWLMLSNKDNIDYAVYFDSDAIVVCDRQFHHHRFETSPASERLDHCVFYLDEIHTRGTDFKFPNGFRAAVTLGNDLTKDRFVQACMRMRKLGNGHALTFWSSKEVHQQIITLKDQSWKEKHDTVTVKDILLWVYQNTVHSTWEGLHHWAAQSLSFQRKVKAFGKINWRNEQQEFTSTIMKELATECLEPEVTELKHMYGARKKLCTIDDIYLVRYQQFDYDLSIKIYHAVLERLINYGGTKQRLTQLLDDEQQRELEHELEEERQFARPSPTKPCNPILHKEIKQLCNTHDNILKLDQLRNVFQPLPYTFTNTTFSIDCQPDIWYKNLWVSTEFQRVILTKGESLNPFLRPPRWIIVYRNEHIILISAFEANWLIDRLKSSQSSTTTLRLLLPRTKRIQSIFVNTPTLMIPASVRHPNETVHYNISLEWLVQLFIFNGTLYFETEDEQKAYCECLGLCSKPRAKKEEEAFEKGWIAIDGFVSDLQHRLYLQIIQARFKSNPLTFVKNLIENRNNLHAPITSHVGSIIFNSQKLI